MKILAGGYEFSSTAPAENEVIISKQAISSRGRRKSNAVDVAIFYLSKGSNKQ